MILDDIYACLAASAELKTALGAGVGDGKIYPNYARISSRAPYVVYRSTNPGGTQDEVLSTEQLTLIITSDTFAQTVEISRIISGLLDLAPAPPQSARHNIYYGKKIGGSDYLDELGRHVRALNFIIKFNRS